MKKRLYKSEDGRVSLIFDTFSLICLLLVSRLFSIQVLNHQKYKTMAQEQYWNVSELPAKRGDIISSDGFVMATTQNHYLIFIEPKKVINKLDLESHLVEFILNAKYSNESNDQKIEIEKNLRERIGYILNSNLVWAAFERGITPVQKQQIEELNLSGVGFEPEPVGYYPEGTLASSVLGFVGSDENGNKKGYFGVEGKFDGELKGRPGKVVEEKDALGVPILIGGYKRFEPIEGSQIVLTVDRTVQYIVEKRLKEGVEKYDSVSGSVIVMDPFTGDIIAMANYPSFDPSRFWEEPRETTLSEKRLTVEQRNLSVAETYEPGSIVKPLTVSAAIDLNKVTKSTTYEDNGPASYSGYLINNWDGKHYGTMTVVELLQKSNNIGAAWVGHKVGSKDLHKYLSNFGLGTRTGIELEGEDSGILRDYLDWTDIDLANISFGQGVSATPLQMINAFNVIANGGNLYQPRIISKIVNDKKVLEMKPRKIRTVISKNTADTMNEILESTVAGGESKYFNLKNYRISGKTGTAQVPVNGRYDPKKTNATFVGYLTGTKKFSMIVRLDRPESSPYAAETAVPLWMLIASDLVKYYGITPDNTQYSN